jgi:hypothetical protein
MTKLIYVLLLLLSFAACGKPIKDVTHDQLTQTHTRPVADYETARVILFGELHYNNGVITDVYCEEQYDAKHGVGKGRIPDPKFLNCEHTWPQSKFVGSEAGTMKTDLHHLYPSNSKSNSTRSNNPFGLPDRNKLVCGTSYIGKVNGVISFEPPDSHKGNVARAMFYFSTRYNLPIDPAQESVLRQWNVLDPVDQFEIKRNKRITEIQGNSNLFIENPSLVDSIRDF